MTDRGVRGSTGLSGTVETPERGILLVALSVVGAMGANDLFLTCMVIFEAHYDAWLAGLFDVVGYIAGLFCTLLAVDSVLKNGLRNRRSMAILAAVSVANFWGTWGGVTISHALR